MTMNAILIKIMPESIETNLEEIKEEVKRKIERGGGRIGKIETEEIAFGLKSLIITLAWPDSKDSDEVENLLSGISGVGSIHLLDVRRSFG